MTMAIILRLDRVMADKKISLNELAEKVGISNVNLSKIKTGNSILHFKCYLGCTGLPTGIYIGIYKRRKNRVDVQLSTPFFILS